MSTSTASAPSIGASVLTSRPARATSARTPRATRAPFGKLAADRLTPAEMAKLPLKQFLAAWGGAR